MISLFAAVSCLSMVQPHESEINSFLPGNSSEMRFEICDINQESEGTLVHGQAWFRLRQRTCAFGRCVTTWQHTGKVLGDAVLDGNCDIQSIHMWSEPPTPMVDEVIPRLEEAAVRRWPDVLNKHPELRQYCER